MSASTASSSTSTASESNIWQERLIAYCKNAQIRPPNWTIASDRRGGRTAWSSAVQIQGMNIPARYWYDGQYVNQAKEDAAEVALQRLGQVPAPPTPRPQHQQQQQQYYGAVASEQQGNGEVGFQRLGQVSSPSTPRAQTQQQRQQQQYYGAVASG